MEAAYEMNLKIRQDPEIDCWLFVALRHFPVTLIRLYVVLEFSLMFHVCFAKILSSGGNGVPGKGSEKRSRKKFVFLKFQLFTRLPNFQLL